MVEIRVGCGGGLAHFRQHLEGMPGTGRPVRQSSEGGNPMKNIRENPGCLRNGAGAASAGLSAAQEVTSSRKSVEDGGGAIPVGV